MSPFQKGVVAKRMGLSLQDNPYVLRTQPAAYNEWRNGWLFAFEGVLV